MREGLGFSLQGLGQFRAQASWEHMGCSQIIDGFMSCGKSLVWTPHPIIVTIMDNKDDMLQGGGVLPRNLPRSTLNPKHPFLAWRSEGRECFEQTGYQNNIWEFPRIKWPFFLSPHNKDHRILGSILSPPTLGNYLVWGFGYASESVFHRYPALV